MYRCRIVIVVFSLVLLGTEPVCGSTGNLSQEARSCLLHGDLETKQTYGDYVVRILRNNFTGCFEILRSGRRLYAEGDARFQIGAVYPDDPKLHPVPIGRDVTGEHQPNLVITSWSGGAHCCFTFQVFQIGSDFKKIAELNAEHGDLSHFEDLHHDGILVFVTNDWTFAYWNTSFLDSPAPDIKLQFRNGKYELAKDLMVRPPPGPARLVDKARVVRVLDPTPWGTPPSRLWSEMLELIYSGNMQLATRFLDLAWNPRWGDKKTFQREFDRQLSKSPYWPQVRQLSAETIPH